MLLYFCLLVVILGYLIVTNLSRNIVHLTILGLIILSVSSMRTYIEGFVAYEIPDEDSSDTTLGAKQEHLELAYRLCMHDSSSNCQDYIHHYDMLKSSHRRLKKGFCTKHPERCQKLGL